MTLHVLVAATCFALLAGCGGPEPSQGAIDMCADLREASTGFADGTLERDAYRDQLRAVVAQIPSDDEVELMLAGQVLLAALLTTHESDTLAEHSAIGRAVSKVGEECETLGL